MPNKNQSYVAFKGDECVRIADLLVLRFMREFERKGVTAKSPDFIRLNILHLHVANPGLQKPSAILSLQSVTCASPCPRGAGEEMEMALVDRTNRRSRRPSVLSGSGAAAKYSELICQALFSESFWKPATDFHTTPVGVRGLAPKSFSHFHPAVVREFLKELQFPPGGCKQK
jgi:hypothetical protein